MTRRAGRWIGWFAAAVVAAVVVWLAGDAFYAVRVERRLAAWEAGVQRGPDGVRVGCEAFSVGEGDIALLLIHGFADAPAVFRPLAAAWAEDGFACRAMRLPGFAEPMAAYRGTSLEAWKAAVTAEAEALRRTHREVWMVGHSTGAALAVAVLLADPGLADGVIMLAPLFAVSGERSPVLSPEGWFHIGRRIFRRTDVLENEFPLVARDPSAADYPYRDRFVPMNVHRDLFRLMDELESRASEVTHPVWMAVAAADLVIDTQVALAFFEALGSTRSGKVVLQDSGHVIPIDAAWPRVAREAAAFIRGGEGDS
jgi:carboxylesterase